MSTNSSFFMAIGAVALLAGCATTVPKAQFSRQAVPAFRVLATDVVTVNVDASPNVQILASEKQRIAAEIEQKINGGKLDSKQSAGQRAYDVDVHLTRYQKGNKLARLMLAGLGQMHIDGDIDVFQMPDHTPIEAFQLSKTFAWGGAYGASASITDIESAFAQGVATTLTGTPTPTSKAAM